MMAVALRYPFASQPAATPFHESFPAHPRPPLPALARPDPRARRGAGRDEPPADGPGRPARRRRHRRLRARPEAPAAHRARRRLHLRRQRPRRVGGGDREPARARPTRCWCRAPGTSPNPGRCRPRRWAAAWCARRGAKACRSTPRPSSRRCATTAAREIVAVFVVHTDTASGVTSDLAALRAAIDAADHPALFVVDVVASLGAAPFDDGRAARRRGGGRVAEGPDVPAGRRLRGGQRGRDRASAAAQPGAALLLGLGAAARATCRTASSAARRRRTC